MPNLIAAQFVDPPAAPDLLSRTISAALTGLAPNSRRVYAARIAAWIGWQGYRPILDRESVKSYLRSLELSGASARVRNSALSALKRVAYESAELGWIDPSSAAQIEAIKISKVSGIRSGRWLTADGAYRLMSAPDRTTLAGRRDAAVLALLVGCGLRRAELCDLTTDHIQRRGDRIMIANLIGKGGRMRSVTVPEWARTDIESWIEDLRAYSETA